MTNPTSKPGDKAMDLLIVAGLALSFAQIAEHLEQGPTLQAFRVGGMTFLKIRYFGRHKLCLSFCLTTK